MRAADPFSFNHVSVRKIHDSLSSRISSLTVSVLSFEMDLMFSRAICKSGSGERVVGKIVRSAGVR